MRTLYLFILVVLLAGMGGGVFLFAQRFHDSWERAMSAKVESKMLEIELAGTSPPAKKGFFVLSAILGVFLIIILIFLFLGLLAFGLLGSKIFGNEIFKRFPQNGIYPGIPLPPRQL